MTLRKCSHLLEGPVKESVTKENLISYVPSLVLLELTDTRIFLHRYPYLTFSLSLAVGVVRPSRYKLETFKANFYSQGLVLFTCTASLNPTNQHSCLIPAPHISTYCTVVLVSSITQESESACQDLHCKHSLPKGYIIHLCCFTTHK